MKLILYALAMNLFLMEMFDNFTSSETNLNVNNNSLSFRQFLIFLVSIAERERERKLGKVQPYGPRAVRMDK